MSYSSSVTGGVVIPDLRPITAEEISEESGGMVFPQNLLECWHAIGCGAFQSDAEGHRLTSFTNRLLAPCDLSQLRQDISPPSFDPFERGMPFFETADGNYLVLVADGTVAYQTGVLISPALENFLQSLVRDPEFWIGKLN